jgi:hypothetical protein
LQEITIAAPEYKAAQSEIYASLKAALEAGKEVPEVITEIFLQMNKELSPLIERVGSEVAKLVQLMLDRVGGQNLR